MMSRSLVFAMLLGAAAATGGLSTKKQEKVDSDAVKKEHVFLAANPEAATFAAAADTKLAAAADVGDKILSLDYNAGLIAGGVAWIAYGTADEEIVLITKAVVAGVNVKASAVEIKTGLKFAHAAGTAFQQVKVNMTKITATTTITPWDSSSGSSGTSSDSLVSDSLNADSSLKSYSLGSGTSSGSQQSGSSGSYMNNWLWAFVLLALVCLVAAALMMGKSKPKKKATKKKAAPAPAPAPVAEAEVVVEPLLPALTPLATTSAVVPSYSMVAPASAAYAMPATTAYAAPYAGTTAYAAPGAYV